MTPETIALMGSEVAIIWSNGQEDFIPMETLRACSPSAENIGESDIFGRIMGGDPRKEFPGVTAVGYEYIGRYAIAFTFSDGHNSGLYSYKYLLKICQAIRQGENPNPKQ